MNSHLENAIQRLLDVAQKEDLPSRIRIDILKSAQDVVEGHSEYEEQMRELRELLYRNPAFPDDLMGYWDDDLPDEDEEDD